MINLDKLKEPYVIILIGPPLSGKTTWVRQNFEPGTFEMISRDEIVMDVYGDDDYNTAFKNVDQKEVDRILISKMRDAADQGKNTIIDMTHMNSKRRKYNLSFFEDHYKLAVIFPILSDQEYDLRNKKRTQEENKTIPFHVIKNMISSYQPIKETEGFDRVISI